MSLRNGKNPKHSGGHFASDKPTSGGSSAGGHFSTGRHSAGSAAGAHSAGGSRFAPTPSSDASTSNNVTSVASPLSAAPTTRSSKSSRKARAGRKDKAGRRAAATNGNAPSDGKRKGGKSRLFSNILLIVGIALLLVAGGMWGWSQWNYYQQDQENQKLAAYATVSDSGDEAPKVDWESLKKINADVCGWIQIPGTVINYPVYQGTDNDHYLNTNAEGTYGVGGQIFLDYQCTNPGMANQQTLIYGHHLKNGSMFKQVADMDQQEFFDSIETVWYVTEEKNYELEPLFVYYTDENDTNVRKFDFTDSDEFHTYLSELLAKAVTKRSDADKIVTGIDHVLTLSTCNYIEGYGRTILVCAVKSEAAKATQSS